MHYRGSVNWCSHCGLSAGRKVKWSYYYDLAMTLLGMYQEMTFTDKRDNCVSCVHCSTIDRSQDLDQPRCPSTDESVG